MVCRTHMRFAGKRPGHGLSARHRAAGHQFPEKEQDNSWDVYALPGRIDDPFSEGCNELIARKAAEAVTGINSLLDSIGLGPASSSGRGSLKSRVYNIYKDREGADLAAGLSSLADLIYHNRDITLERLCQLTGMDFRETAAMEYWKVTA